MTEAGFTLSLPAEVLEALEERIAERVLRRLEAARPTSPYLNVEEAADYLRCSRQRVYDLLSAGRLTRRKDGTRTLVLRVELDRYVAGELSPGCHRPASPLAMPARARRR